ncbi:MAG TPA: DnaB family ATPase [Dongiaceae bacterium]|nr:DnaB family ATPase [Dongiaceae bacterium]
MDPKLLLVKIITLLHNESKLADRSVQSGALCKEAIGTIRQAETTLDTEAGREIMANLKSTALWMCDAGQDQYYEKSSFYQRIKLNTAGDESLFEAIERGTSIDADPDALKRAVTEVRKEIRQYFNQIKIKEILTDSFRRVNYRPETVNWDTFVHEHAQRLEPYMTNGDAGAGEMIDEFDFDNVDLAMKLFKKAKDEQESIGIMTFGLQGFNRMWGKKRGARGGEFLIIGALPHMYKSGLCLDLFRWICQYNTPVIRTPGKKPLVAYISFENDIPPNVMELYIRIREQETGQKVDPKTINLEEAFLYLKDKLQSTGYTVKLLHFDPTNFTHQDLFDLVIKWELEGFEVHSILCDYLNMMSKKGCDHTGAQGGAIRDLYRRTRNFMSKRGIFFATPHQLSPGARQLVRNGSEEDFAKEVATKGYYDDCSKIDQEADIEIICHLVTVNGVKYLTMQRGKHRYNVTPVADLFVVYRFNEVGGIVDDIGKPDTSRKVVGGDTLADGGGGPFWS